MSELRKRAWQMAALVAASLVLGLGANFLAEDPLPLLRRPPAEAPAPVDPSFGLADAEFVRQFRADPAVVLLDARTNHDFARGHIPGALHLPISRFAEAFPSLEKRLRAARMVVVYCSDPHCSDSHDLALRLRQEGLAFIFLYRGGMEDWLEKGHALER
ncbi:MAG: rhodanese-like domain-containing protein [Candidatus Aminicenantes bacterium]|nr:rhodanese-like domain-containing protein [Candidatus Aminicenantes bacterium]